MDWSFSNIEKSPSVAIEKNGTEVIFHPIYSSGTAAVRGDKPLSLNMHHYWELRMGSVLYGTDVSVGVGTKNVCYNSHTTRFVTLLGLDGNSWGYSYTGFLHHNDSNTIVGGTPRLYATQKWVHGTIVGVHLDRWNGTIQFFLDGVPLGIGFRDLPRTEELYPMVSSTAAKSRMSLLCAQSYPSNLAFECVRQLSRACLKSKGDRRFEFPSDKARRKSLLAVNNMAILLKNGTCTARNYASLNRTWIRLLPPGIQNFIDRNCWYIVGTRACKHNRIEKSQKRLKCKPGHSDKDETHLHPSDGGNTDDSNYWDDFTDDESKISMQTAKKPKKHCLKKSQSNRNTTEVDNELPRCAEDSSDDDDIQNFFGRVEHSSTKFTEGRSISCTDGGSSNYVNILQTQRDFDTDLAFQSPCKKGHKSPDISYDRGATNIKGELSCETRTNINKPKSDKSSTVVPEQSASTNTVTTENSTKTGRLKRFMLTKRKH